MTAVHADCLTRIEAEGLIAVIRADSAADAVAAGHALRVGGVRALEVTFTTPGAEAAIEALAAHEELLVGAGTVLDGAQASAAIDAGARFLVSPSLVPDAVAVAERAGVLAVPGAMTPTEVIAAARCAPVVKLFPAGVGGPAYLRSLLAPLPELRLVPTGGVRAEDAAAWLDAGAFALGAGADLCAPELMRAGDFAALTERARRYRSALSRHGARVR